MRAFFTGSTLLVVGVMIGVLVGPHVREPVTGRTEAATLVQGPTATGVPPSPLPSPAVSPSPEVTPVVTSTPFPLPELVAGQPVVVGLGDSITFNANSWFRQVCHTGRVLSNCVDSGVRGNTTAQMLVRLESDVLAWNPRFVVVMGGTNDLKARVPAKTIMRRLDMILDRIRATGTPAVLCTIPPRDRFGPEALKLNNAIRTYARKGRIPLLDLYPAIGNGQGTFRPGMSDDGTHPNDVGAARMTELAERKLPGLIASLSGASFSNSLSPGFSPAR